MVIKLVLRKCKAIRITRVVAPFMKQQFCQQVASELIIIEEVALAV
jgi:hypothetical protein